jgi:Zn-dependent protease with chaperone function
MTKDQDHDRDVRAIALGLPSDTLVRFVALVLLTVATTIDLLIMMLGGVTGADDEFFSCAVDSRLFVTGGAGPYQQFQACFADSAQRMVTTAGAALALLGAVTIACWWSYPRMIVRRRGLKPLDAGRHRDLIAYLAGLGREAGPARQPVFLIDPGSARPVGQAFGRPGRHRVSLAAGLLTLYTTDRPRFRSVVLHELAHLRNRDVSLTYLTVVMWRVFVTLVLLPWLLITVFGGRWSDVEWWRVALLLALVFLARNAVLRAREYAADARAAQWDTEAATSLRQAGMISTRRPWWRRPGPVLVHPSPRARLAALADPASLLAPSLTAVFVAGLATGLLVKHFEVPFYLLGFSNTGVLVVGLTVVFASTMAGFVAVLGWRLRDYVRLRGRIGGRVVLAVVLAGAGLPFATWLTFLAPRLPAGGVTGLVVHVAPVVVVAFAVLWAFAYRVRRFWVTYAVSAVLIGGWAGWWADPTWRDDLPGLVALASEVRESVLHLGVLAPTAVLARDLAAQAAAILIWLVPAVTVAAWRRGALGRATRIGAVAGAVALGTDLMLRTWLVAAEQPTAAVALSWQILLVAVVQAGAAWVVQRRGPALVAVYAGYLAGALGVVALVVNGVVGGCLPWLHGCGVWPSVETVSRVFLSVVVIGTMLTGVVLVVGRVLRGRVGVPGVSGAAGPRLEALESRSPAPPGEIAALAGRGRRVRALAAIPAVPVVLALLSVTGVVAAERTLDRAYASTPSALPDRPVSGDPAVTAAAVRSWLENGGRETIDALDAAGTALDAADDIGDPAGAFTACEQLAGTRARAGQLPAPPDTEAAESWADALAKLDQTLAACPPSPGADDQWQLQQRKNTLVFGRLSLEVTKLFLLGALD